MKRLVPMAALAVSATLATACVDDTVAPEFTPAYSVAGADRHIVAFNGQKGIPTDFEAVVKALGGRVEHRFDAVGGAIVSGLSPAAVASLSRNRNVMDIELEDAITLEIVVSEPELIGDAEPMSPEAPHTGIIYARQWNMRAILAHEAWAEGRLGSSAVTVAILDTGIDYQLPDLAGRVDLSRSASFVADDDFLMGIVFPARHPSADLSGHGTNVASQVVSNAIYLAGVTSQTRLMSVKVCGLRTSCPWGSIFAGFYHAVDHGAHVINMSLGGSFLKRGNGATVAVLNRLFQYAEQNGVTVVVSAGNSATDMDHDPNAHKVFCAQTHVICVSATGPRASGPAFVGPFEPDVDEPSFYTNYGRKAIDVAAPGGNYTLNPITGGVATAGWIWSLCPRTRMVWLEGTLYYTNCSFFPQNLYASGYAGTSQAAPHVTGLAALIIGEGVRNPAQVRALIRQHADDLGETGVDPYYGSGRINVAATGPRR
jgi:lantibiotic leader peptide-processing serine protease